MVSQNVIERFLEKVDNAPDKCFKNEELFAKYIIYAALEAILDEAIENGVVSIRGLGKFERRERMGRAAPDSKDLKPYTMIYYKQGTYVKNKVKK